MRALVPIFVRDTRAIHLSWESKLFILQEIKNFLLQPFKAILH